MSNDNLYDYIIAGAGASGLTLLWYMMHELSAEKKILVIDTSFGSESSKIWSFWGEEAPLLTENSHRWHRLEVHSGNTTFSESLKRFTYHSLRSDEFRERILQKARSRENIFLLESDITGFSAGPSGGTVSTVHGVYQAEWIFQSILKADHHHSSRVDNMIIQHFTGWEIETDSDLFDPEKVTLMDLDTEQRGGLTFFYILPFSKKRALIEYTIFSESVLEKSAYESAIIRYIKNEFSLERGSYRILRKESGNIPMEDRRVPGYYNARTINIGTVGGLTKPTTGYTLTRIHAHSRRITRLLKAGREPEAWRGSSYRFRVYDILLLYLLKNEPESCREIFHTLFEKNRMETVLSFLGERTDLLQEAGIFLKMPYLPFFRAIYRMKHRILTGA